MEKTHAIGSIRLTCGFLVAWDHVVEDKFPLHDWCNFNMANTAALSPVTFIYLFV